MLEDLTTIDNPSFSEEDRQVLAKKLSDYIMDKGKSGLDEAIQGALDDMLTEYGFGSDEKRAAFLLITSDASDVAFDMDRLELPEQSKVAAKLKSYDVIGKVNTLKDLYGKYKDVRDMFNSFESANEHITTDQYGRVTGWSPKGREELANSLDSLITVINDIIGDTPGARYYAESLEIISRGVHQITELVNKEDMRRISADMLLKYDSESMGSFESFKSEYSEYKIYNSTYRGYVPYGILEAEYESIPATISALYDIVVSESKDYNEWKKGPSTRVLAMIYDDYAKEGVSLDFLDTYLEWRAQYEADEFIKDWNNHLNYLEKKHHAANLNRTVAKINAWKNDPLTDSGAADPAEPSEDDKPKKDPYSEVKSKYGKDSHDKIVTYIGESTGGSAPPLVGGEVWCPPKNHLDVKIEFDSNDLANYYKELMKTDPERAKKEYKEFLEDIEGAKGYLEKEDIETLEDLAEEIEKAIPDIAGDEYDDSTEVQPPRDPLIIDLGGDGFTLKQVGDGVHFDLDKNGFAEKTGWAAPSEGFLAIDKNKNGFIDDGGELFGDQYVKSDGTIAASGFDALRDLDDDVDEETGKKGDGKIDKKDSRFGELLVWKDLNQNGVAEKNELQTLAQAEIESISLAVGEGDSKEVETGIIQSERSTVTKTNGDTVDIAEHWFKVKAHDTVEHDSEGNIITADSVDTFGNVRNLSDAIYADETGALEDLVDAFKASSDYAEKRVLIKKILFAITDSNAIDPGARGGNIDARELNVIEKFMGREFIGAEGSSTPNSLAAPMLKEVYYKLENLYFNLLNKEGEAGIYLDQVLVNRDENGVPSLDYSFFNYSTALRMLLGDDVDDSVYSVASVLRQYDLAFKQNEFDSFASEYTELSAHFSDMADMIKTGSVLFGTESGEEVEGSLSSDIIWGDGGDDTIKAGGGRDFIYGGEGDDVLEGGEGDDNYYFGKDHGKDTVKDRAGSTKLIFTDGISEEDYSSRITVSGKSIGFTLENKETGDRVDLPDFIADPTDYSFIFEGSDSVSGVADERDTVNGTDGDDELEAGDGFNIFYGGEGSDTLAGGKDIDFMYGGEGDDTLLGRNGTNVMYGEGGNDIIYDGDDSGYLSGGADDDKLYGGGGADVLDGGKGNDYLQGDHGNDTYIFGKGYDEDTIAASSDLHTIIIHDYAPDQMHCVRYQNNDLVIDFGYSNTDKIIVKRFFDFNANRDYNFVFDNGTVLGQHDIVAESAPIVGTDGDDYLYATDGNDTLDGGAGNDTLCGAGGTDKYIFGKGYGADSINEWGSDKSTIILKDIKSDEVTFADQWGSNLQIFVNDSEDVLTVSNFKWGQATYEFEFADGAKGYVDKSTWKFVFTKEPDPVEEDTEQAAAELLDTLYSDTADIGSDLLSENADTVISELTESASAGEESISDITDIQTMLLAENMSAFSDDSQISDTMDIADITADSSALGQLLVNSAQ